MTAKIVLDYDVTGPQCWNEDLFDIGEEVLAIYWAVEDARGCQFIDAQSGQKRLGVPVSVGYVGWHTLALAPPPTQRGHIGLDPGFIDKDQTGWIEAALQGFPAPAAAGNIRS